MMMSGGSVYNNRKRLYGSTSSLPFKKLCVNTPDDYLEAMEDEDFQQTRSSCSSSDRFVSGCSSSGEENSRFEFVSAIPESRGSNISGTETEESMDTCESDLSETDYCSTSGSSAWTEREEDGYSSDFFFAVESASESEDNEPCSKYVAVTVMDSTAEMLRVRFPFTSIRIKVSDFMCLGEGDFLNENLVDFYLNHLVSNVIDEDKYRVHVFGSVFWHRLRLNIFKADQNSHRQQRLHSQFKNMRSYMHHINLFENDFAIFPIHELDHWSLAVVCNLESVIPEDYIIEGLTDDGEPLPRHAPCILMLDPLGSDNSENRASLIKYGKIIRELLEYEYSQFIGNGQDCSERFTQDAFPIVFPANVPQQVNFCDSGVYILQYATDFLTEPPSLADLAFNGFDFKEEYPQFSVKKKRSDIQHTLLSLCEDKDKWKKLLDVDY